MPRSIVNLPTWETYCNYLSGNYGVHALTFTLPDRRQIWFSYNTPVAFRSLSGQRYVRQNDWSTTTGKHLNAIDGGDKRSRIGGEEFERLLSAEFAGLQAVAA